MTNQSDKYFYTSTHSSSSASRLHTTRALTRVQSRGAGAGLGASPNEGACDWCDWCDDAPGRNGPSTLSYSKKLSSSYAQPVMPPPAARAGELALCAPLSGARFARCRRAFAREPRAFVSSRGRSTGTFFIKSRAFHRERRVRDHLAGRTAEFLVRAVRVYGLAYGPPRRRLDVAPQTAPQRTRGVGDDATVGVAILAARVGARDATVVAVLHVRRHRPSPSSEFQALHPRRVRGHVRIRALETHAHAANAGAWRRKRFGFLRARLAAYARLGPPRRRRARLLRGQALPTPASAAAAATAIARDHPRRRAAPESPTCLTLPPPIPRSVARLRQRPRAPSHARHARASSHPTCGDGAVDASVRRFARPTGAGAAAASGFRAARPPRPVTAARLQLAFSNASISRGRRRSRTLEDARNARSRFRSLFRTHLALTLARHARARRVRGACTQWRPGGHVECILDGLADRRVARSATRQNPQFEGPDERKKRPKTFIQKSDPDAAAHRARCPRRATDDMSAFTVSAVAAPGATKFASRNANARRPAAAPARVVRRAGRVAQRVVAKAGPSGEVKKVRATTRSGNAAVRSKTRRSRATFNSSRHSRVSLSNRRERPSRRTRIPTDAIAIETMALPATLTNAPTHPNVCPSSARPRKRRWSWRTPAAWTRPSS